MYEFLMENSLYTVLIIFLIGMIGIFTFLTRLGSAITSLEKEND